MAIGPKEICVENHRAIKDIYMVDSSDSVEKYKIYAATRTEECMNGDLEISNMLLLAASFANETLIKYIVENADPRILDMRDSYGYTALHKLVVSARQRCPIQKVLACAEILINKGANLNTRFELAKQHYPNSLPTTLDEDKDFSGNNMLGYLVSRMKDATIESKRKLESITLLFLLHGAKKGYATDCGWFSLDDAVDKSDKSERASYVRNLNRLSRQLPDWSKSILLFGAHKDPTSPLSNLPIDLIKLIFNKTIDLESSEDAACENEANMNSETSGSSSNNT